MWLVVVAGLRRARRQRNSPCDSSAFRHARRHLDPHRHPASPAPTPTPTPTPPPNAHGTLAQSLLPLPALPTTPTPPPWPDARSSSQRHHRNPTRHRREAQPSGSPSPAFCPVKHHPLLGRSQSRCGGRLHPTPVVASRWWSRAFPVMRRGCTASTPMCRPIRMPTSRFKALPTQLLQPHPRPRNRRPPPRVSRVPVPDRKPVTNSSRRLARRHLWVRHHHLASPSCSCRSSRDPRPAGGVDRVLGAHRHRPAQSNLRAAGVRGASRLPPRLWRADGRRCHSCRRHRFPRGRAASRPSNRRPPGRLRRRTAGD